MVNLLLQTSHSISSSALCLCGSVPSPSSILRTHFQVPYPVSPLLATLTKTLGVWGYSSHFETRTSFHFFASFITSLLPCLFPFQPSPRVARWTDGRRQAIISSQQHWQGWQLLQRRGNEHFSKHTEPAGVVWLRIHGDAAVDRSAVRRGDCRAGGAGLLGIYDGDAQ